MLRFGDVWSNLFTKEVLRMNRDWFLSLSLIHERLTEPGNDAESGRATKFYVQWNDFLIIVFGRRRKFSDEFECFTIGLVFTYSDKDLEHILMKNGCFLTETYKDRNVLNEWEKSMGLHRETLSSMCSSTFFYDGQKAEKWKQSFSMWRRRRGICI